MRSNRASKTGIQLKMFRKQLTKQFRGLSIIHTVEQCEGSNFSSGSQWLNLVRDEVILRKVNDPDSTPLDSIQLWQWGRSSTKPCRAGIFHLWSDDGLTLQIVMWMQQSRICILIVLQEKPFCVQISFVFYCF